MRPGDGVRGVARPGRGDDVDLEALQDAFLRSAERPSAKVSRAKPPTIKAGSSLGVRKEDDDPRSGRGGADTANAPRSTGGGAAAATAVAAATAISPGTQPTRDNNNREPPRSLGVPPEEREKGPLTSASSPTGGMILNAPGVVSKSVREREVKPPAPMRIGGFAGGAGAGGAIGRRGDKQRFGLAKGAKHVTAVAERGIIGGFPAVRHRSEMGLVKLGVGAAAASTGAPPATAAAAAAAAKGNAATERGGRGGAGRGGGGGVGNIPGDIHEENLSRISAMSPDEIADAQQEIRAALPPGALEMLLRRGRGGGGKTRAATAAGGIDSEEALEAALLTLPPEERAKSRWTLTVSGDAAVTTAAAAAVVATAAAGGPGGTGGRGGGDEARVDLDGAVVVLAGDGGGGSASDGGEGLEALHHHGDDPDKAGYTPSELVRLARSTVSGQRQLALRALAGVLRFRAACIARGQTPPHRRLPEMLPVAIRLCLDDGNPSVTSAALNATEALLAPLARDGEDEERAMQGLSWVDYQAFPCEPRPLCTPEEKQHLPPLKDSAIEEEGDETPGDGGEGEGGKTVRELARLCYEDPCRGLLEMALLPKIASVIKSYADQVAADGAQAASDGGGGLGDKGSFHGAARATAAATAVSFRPRAALSCLRVLCAVAGRAPWAAERVASEPGLLDAVREAFLEPRADGTLPLDLSETAPATVTATAIPKQLSPPPPQEPATSARAEGKARTEGPRDANGCPPPPPQEQLALLAVRLARVLVQSGRGVALALSQTPLLGSTKGWLALGQGSRRPLPALEAVQREVLELWRCCLSYGVDVAAADTVVLVARGQGWWPGLSGGVGAAAAAAAAAAPLVADSVTVERGGGGGGGSGGGVGEEPTAAAPVGAESVSADSGVGVGDGVGGVGAQSSSGVAQSTSGGAGGGSRGGDSLPPRLAFYRALHQLACACVLPPGVSAAGRNKNDGAETAGGDGKAGAGAAGTGVRKEAEGFSVGGVAVVPESWADVGDTVDAAVEGALLWLLSGVRGGGRVGGGGAAETAQQAAAVHLVACWVERYQAMSRTIGRRGSRHLESTAEDAAVLFSSLLASPALPLPAAVAATTAVTRRGDQSGGSGGSGGSGSGDGFSQRGVSSGEAAAAAGLDWLSGVFRLGLACERAVPGEAAAALASAPEATAAALAAFLAAAGTAGAGAAAADRASAAPTAAVAPPPATFLRRVRRAEAGARWLGCRLLALGCRGGGREGGWPWAALRRDCALQAMALCERGDEAIAVGLLAEALPGSTVDSPEEEGSERPSDDPAAAAVGTAAASTSLLRMLFRGAISDPVALSQSSFHLDGRWASLQSLKACTPPGTASLLPLPPHWLFLPLASQGGEKAASTAVSACLSLLVQLEREESAYVWSGGGGGGTGCVSPEVKLYHLANACLYGASVLSGLGVVQHFDWLFSRYAKGH
ncbi:Protein of unknown function [Ectocarpus siliculosus]|uniref:RNA polymerase II-associated protein 1 C-terminal domain-containing protein n=1 Tax=Ectocarpus siliculosus TaxID=2880 RepID=D8LHI7_ECTSI|nr:Protein of unknown function [Ectocarpus siliculosus]|eukprot:CBN79269.1 Protein of unknown function [Ectocarpus siliculosus]